MMGPPPKSDPPPAVPISTTLPPRSTATPFPASFIPPPNALDQTGSPAAEYFARKISVAPALVMGPVPKSTVPLNFPVTSTLPLPSTASELRKPTRRPGSEPDSPTAPAPPAEAAGAGPAFAAGGRLASWTTAVSLERGPLLSVTGSMTLYVPGVVYVWEVTVPDAE